LLEGGINNMNKNLNVMLGLVLVFALVAQIGMTVDSFPGFHSGSDCSYCHNEPATAVYENTTANPTITLDGEADEEYWDHTYGRRMYVQAVFRDQVTRVSSEIIFVQITFAQNTTHLFVLAEWDTQGTSNAGAAFDGISILWNINATEENPNYPEGMMTKDGYADVWMLKATEAGANNTIVESAMEDWSMDDEGILKSETDDVKAVLRHHVELVRDSPATFYIAEFARKLTTAESTDVQFNMNKYYTYDIAIFNESSGVKHLTAFTHEVYVQGNSVDPTPDARYEGTEIITYHQEVRNEVDVTNTITETKSETPMKIGFFVVSLISTVAIMVLTKRRN
jgi:hypothetical protein